MVKGTKLDPNDVVIEFIRYYVKHRGQHSWIPTNFEALVKSWTSKNRNCKQDLEKVVQKLESTSEELLKFIEKTHQIRFNELTSGLSAKILEDDEPPYEEFRVVVDELFLDGISWCKIVTFLVYLSETCTNVLSSNGRPYMGPNNLVDKVAIWMSEYIDENLLQWIKEQDGDWASVLEVQEKRDDTRNRHDSNDTSNNRTYLNGFGVAAFAILIGTSIYLCSKFTSFHP